MLCFCLTRILLASLYCIKKKPGLTGTVIQELTRQSKIHEQSIHLTATKTIIETSREYFSISIYSRKHQASFYSVNVGLCTNCAARNLSHELAFQPIPRCCRELEEKANMFCIIRASSQTQSN